MPSKRKVNEQDGLGRTKLHLTCQDDDVGPLRMLLDAGAKIEIADGLGLTPMHMAIRCGNASVVRELIARGAKLDFKDKTYGGTYLHFALQQENSEIVHALVEAGVAINEKDNGGWPPISYAVGREDSDRIRYLVAHGADVEFRNERGQGLIDSARHLGNEGLVQLLLELGAPA